MSEEVLCDVSAERAVLAGICQFGQDSFLDVADMVSSRSFVLPENQAIYRCLEHLVKDGDVKVDLAGIYSACTDLNLGHLIESKEEREVLRAVLNFPIGQANVRKMAARVSKLEIARLLRAQLDTARVNLEGITGTESLAHILGLVEGPILDFSSKLNDNNEGPKLIGEGLREYVEHLASNPVQQIGLSSGFPQWDTAIGGGLRKKTVNLIGARAKMGKSLFSIAVAKHVAGKNKIPTLLVDSEMSQEDQNHRLLANISGVTIREIETGSFAKDAAKRRRVGEAVAFLEEAPFHYLSVANNSFEDVLALMRRWFVRNVGVGNDCLIIYDYLKIMSSEGISESLKEHMALGFLISAIHNFAHRHSLPFLTMTQLNRDGQDSERVDTVAGSDRLIWLCSNFSIFKKKSDDEVAEEITNGKNVGNRKLVPIVCRHGPGLEQGDYISMRMDGAIAKIEEAGTRNEIHNISPKSGFVIDSDAKEIDFGWKT